MGTPKGRHIEGSQRKEIKKMTKASLIRLMFVIQCTEANFMSMFTQTYPKHFPRDGKIVKTDVNCIANKFREWGLTYLWFLEFQRRGAPHIHWLLNTGAITPRLRASFGLFWTMRIANSEWFLDSCPSAVYSQEVLKMAKFNINEKAWEVLRSPDGARGYVMKYASKEKQKRVPSHFENVGRFWGSSRSVMPEGVEFDTCESEIEKWLIEHNHPAASWELAPPYVWGIKSLPKRETSPEFLEG